MSCGAAASTAPDSESVDAQFAVSAAHTPQLSPDGRWLAFQKQTIDLAANLYRNELLLTPVNDLNRQKVIYAAPPSAHSMPSGYSVSALFTRWRPDSLALAFETPEGLRVYEVESGRIRSVVVASAEQALNGARSLAWSPDGRHLAFIQSTSDTAAPPDPNRGVEVDVDWDPGYSSRAITLQTPSYSPRVLHVIELAGNRVTRLSAPNHDVINFSWSPDSPRLAYSAVENPDSASSVSTDTDLFTVDLERRHVTPLVRQPGGDTEPAWSPDGKWIAFVSQAGETDRYLYSYYVAVVAADGSGSPSYPIRHHNRTLFRPIVAMSGLTWTGDSQALLLNVIYGMRGRAVRVPRKGGEPRVLIGGEKLELVRDCSFDVLARRAVCVREGPAESPELYLYSLASGKSRQLTHYNAALEGAQTLTAEEAVWRSFDNRWDIHGIVMKPPGFDPHRTYPLLVLVEGGPQQVRSQFNIGGANQYPLYVLARRGYVILAPNTRGRGGYGDDFQEAIGNEGNRFAHPFQDVMSGVDHLIRAGFVDPERLGIMGFSYGSGLSAYAITQTNRFKAASFNGTFVSDHAVDRVTSMPRTLGRLRFWLLGIRDGFDPADRLRVDQDWVIENIERLRTPTLMLPGIDESKAVKGNLLLLNACRHFGVPAELVVYPRSGHGMREPALLRDHYERNIEWFDYWVGGIATERMLKRYGAPANPPRTEMAKRPSRLTRRS